MQDRYSKIQKFFTACDELVNGTFMLADTRIADVLNAVAGSGELTNLFNAATESFDYNAAKKAYLRYPAGKGETHGIVYFPTDRKQILAFVFCVLVEIDAGVMKFNDFLLRYFYQDGSYTASYAVFAERMIRPFRDIVRDCFPDSGRKDYLERLGKRRDGILETLTEKITIERERISRIALRDTEQDAAETIFAELIAAAGRKDAAETAAILAGYRYFLLYINAVTPESEEILRLAEDL